MKINQILEFETGWRLLPRLGPDLVRTTAK